MAETAKITAPDWDVGKHIMETLIELLEDQTGVKYTYEEIKNSEDKTA